MGHYLISATPRSGGHVLMGILQACDVQALYTHDPLCRCDDYSQVNLLMITRRDLFATVMSNCIVYKTGQTTNYLEKEIEPFDVDKGVFLSLWVAAERYHKYHDLSRPYQRVENFVYEEIIENYSIVIDRLGLERKIEFSNIKYLHNKSPYNYKQVVKNWPEMRELFDTMDLSRKDNVHASHHGQRYADFVLNKIT